MTWDDEIFTEIRSVSFSKWYGKYSPVEVVNLVCDMPIDLQCTVAGPVSNDG
jgi:hypothetical protein